VTQDHGSARLLTSAANYAVVQLPGRQSPGVVFQGDSLHILISEIEGALAEADLTEQRAEFGYIVEQLKAVQRHYEDVLADANIPLPYFK